MYVHVCHLVHRCLGLAGFRQVLHADSVCMSLKEMTVQAEELGWFVGRAWDS